MFGLSQVCKPCGLPFLGGFWRTIILPNWPSFTSRIAEKGIRECFSESDSDCLLIVRLVRPPLLFSRAGSINPGVLFLARRFCSKTVG